jgi:glucose-1-phosphate cytidylyltransferase
MICWPSRGRDSVLPAVEETTLRPKPMVEIGGRPILWHIMKIYSAHGMNDFVICCGYKGYMIKEYFANYFLHMSDVTFDMRQERRCRCTEHGAEPWRVTLVDTGEATMTGGRLKRVRDYLGDETFCLTYGDGVSDVDITRADRVPPRPWGQATLTAVQPPGRFGALQPRRRDAVGTFTEKPTGDGGWINGGFFVLEPSVIDRIDGDATRLGARAARALAATGDRGLQAPRLLAADGHAARPDPARAAARPARNW